VSGSFFFFFRGFFSVRVFLPLFFSQNLKKLALSPSLAFSISLFFQLFFSPCFFKQKPL